jgi:hypothetical protein
MCRTPFDDAAALTPKDIAARLHVDARSVRQAIARGELVASRTCGLRILVSDAAAWWRAHLVAAAETPAPAKPPSGPRPQAAGHSRRAQGPRTRGGHRLADARTDLVACDRAAGGL